MLAPVLAWVLGWIMSEPLDATGVSVLSVPTLHLPSPSLNATTNVSTLFNGITHALVAVPEVNSTSELYVIVVPEIVTSLEPDPVLASSHANAMWVESSFANS